MLLLSLRHSSMTPLEPWGKGCLFLSNASQYCTLHYRASNHLISLQVIPGDGSSFSSEGVKRSFYTDAHVISQSLSIVLSHAI